MALISKASLLMVPSTYEPGKLYNVLPSGNRAPDNKGGAGYDQTRADFDFDRGSNAAATRIGSDGLLKKYQENLLLQSNNFGTTWGTDSSTITSGQSGYDGSSDAWLLSRTGANGRFGQVISLNGLYTFSLYVKAGTKSFVKFGSSSGNVEAYFNLSNGSITSSGSLIIEAKTTDVGNGWYRCQMTFSATLSYLNIWIADSNGNTTGTTGSILIQSAQVESSLVATEYLNSTSVTAKAGVLIDLPRINYDANGENGSLLLEPSRQQLVPFSEYAGTNNWGNPQRLTTIANQTTSPEGIVNATKVNETAVSGSHMFDYNFSATSGVAYTFSYFAKAAERTQCYLFGYTDGGVFSGQRAIFDLSNGTITSNVGNGVADIKPYSNGWYRVSLTLTSTATSTAGYWGIGLALNSATSYLGVASSGINMYGLQLESSATYPSSYIPNHGTSGGVTRAADSCSVTGASDVIGQTEGTFFVDFTIPETQGPSFFSISDGTYANRIIFGYTAGTLRYYVNSSTGGFSVSRTIDSSPVVGQTYKIALAYKNNDFKVYKNGTNTNTETTFTTPSSLTAIDNQGGGVGQFIFAEVKQFLLFNERLTNAELATLTTL